MNSNSKFTQILLTNLKYISDEIVHKKIDTFYRYGHYASDKTIENFALNFNLSISFYFFCYVCRLRKISIQLE